VSAKTCQRAPLRKKGDGAPKSANPMARALRHAGASRRASRDVSGHRAPLRLKARSELRLKRRQPAPARRRPGAHAACTSPQAPHPVPPHERLMMRPSSGRGACRIKSVLRPGISDAKFVLSPAVPRCARSRWMRSPAVSTPFASPVTGWFAGCSTAGAHAAATSAAEARPPTRQAFIAPQGRPSGRPFSAVW
jgi:hypothetical protein